METETQPKDKDQSGDDRMPTFFGSWKKLYLLVIGNLFILIILFYLLTKSYS